MLGYVLIQLIEMRDRQLTTTKNSNSTNNNKFTEITQSYVTSIDSCLIYDCICNVQLVIIFKCYQNEKSDNKMCHTVSVGWWWSSFTI